MRSFDELTALSKACRAAGVPMPPLTAEEKARAYGDETHGRASQDGTTHRAYETELVRRHDAGEPLSKSDARDARRIKRLRANNL